MEELWRGLTPHKFQWEQCQFVPFKQELSAVQAVYSASSEDTRYLFSLGKTCTHLLVIQSLIVHELHLYSDWSPAAELTPARGPVGLKVPQGFMCPKLKNYLRQNYSQGKILKLSQIQLYH